VTALFFILIPIPIQQIPKPSQNTAFFAASAPLGGVLKDPAGQTADRQRLKPYFAGAFHQGEEESFSTEHPVTDAANKLDVKVYGWLEGYHTTGVHFKDLSCP